MPIGKIRFSGHALQQMHARQVSRDEVLQVLDAGVAIAEYPEDKPFPSKLLLGTVADRPLHIVTAYDSASGTHYIVTVYEPDPQRWSDDFTTRRT